MFSDEFNVDDDDSSSINGFHSSYGDRSKNSIKTGNFAYFYDFYAESYKTNNENSPKTDSSPEILIKTKHLHTNKSSASNSISTNAIRLGSLLPREAVV